MPLITQFRSVPSFRSKEHYSQDNEHISKLNP